MSEMTIDTKQLRELLAKATPAPWVRSLDGKGRYIYSETDAVDNILKVESGEDAGLIVALRNSAPALLDELDRLREAAEVTRAYVDTNSNLDAHREHHQCYDRDDCAIQSELVIRAWELERKLRAALSKDAT